MKKNCFRLNEREANEEVRRQIGADLTFGKRVGFCLCSGEGGGGSWKGVRFKWIEMWGEGGGV